MNSAAQRTVITFFIRGIAATCLFLTSMAAAQDDPLELAANAEQAAVLEAAPVLAEGRNEFDAATLAEGTFAWVEPAEPGFYTFTLSQPGALVLVSFPNADGRYDGKTGPARHGSALSQDQAPVLGPVLLGSGHPYLLSISAKGGAGSVELAKVAEVPALSETPEGRTPIPDGEWLLAPDGRLDLVLAGSPDRRKIEVISEPRADLDARVDGVFIPPGGRYPLFSDEDLLVRVTAKTGKASPPPLVLLRLGAAPGGLDETEPNESEPNALVPGQPFNGMLLASDDDLFSFSLEADSALSLELNLPGDTGAELALHRIDDAGRHLLWTRKPAGGGVDSAPLHLQAGDYRLLLERTGRDTQAAPYTLQLAAGKTPAPNQEAEPNDTPASAQPLSEALRVSGSSAADDYDVYRFSISGEQAGHLWRVFTVDAKRITLSDNDGTITTVNATGRRSMADALALEPGEYRVEVRAEGDYLLRVMDLGPRPSNYEGEPNNDAATGQRLEFGDGVQGGFHVERDVDFYLFRLDAGSATEIEIRPATDGVMDVKLFHGSQQVGSTRQFEAGDDPYRFQGRLAAGDWALAVRSLDPKPSENYEIGVSRLPAIAGPEPDDAPLDAAKMPRDGDFAGSVGAFDGADQVFIPLPEGEGRAALLCQTAPGTRTGRWRVYHWADDSRVVDINDGIALFDYGPALGGAVRFGLDGTNRPVNYACAVRFPPTGAPPEPQVTGTTGDATPMLAPGQARRVTLAAEGPEPVFDLFMGENEIGFATCSVAGGAVLEPSTRAWGLEGVRTPVRELFGPLQPFVAESGAKLKINRTYAQRLDGATLPMDFDCTLYGVDDLPRPADMGPVAAFTAFEQRAAESGSAAPAGPPPPGLEALIARQAPERQPEGDLPVQLAIAESPELAGFSDAGQRFTATATLTSEHDAPLSLDVDIRVDGEGWRVSPARQPITLAAGSDTEVTAEVVAPPWLTPSQRPTLIVKATANDAFAAAATTLTIDGTAVPVDPFVYWHAPEALRGGLNVLLYGLGARITHWGDQPADENLQKREAPLHDGLAPHTGSVNLPPDVSFRLAAPAKLAGVMVQLRSTAGPERWPTEMEVHAPEGADGWRRVATRPLASVHAPQYLVFETPLTADRLRFTFPRCPTNCREVYVQELQAIATPGTHPDGLAKINAADPGLGGHVVWASERFGGAWNREFLVGDPARSNGGWPTPRKTRSVTATVAFHQDRAALVESITWIGDPDDERRIPEGRIDASLDGPDGPWRTVGTLAAPPVGEMRSTLELAKPAWARYLRFTFDLPEQDMHHGPDGIEIIEAPGTSVLGLWEDDLPRAAYEAAIDAPVEAPVQPAGGPDRDNAVALPLGEAVPSSVVIERNEDWWQFTVPEGPVQGLELAYERAHPVVVAELFDAAGQTVTLQETGGEQVLEAIVPPGDYHLRVFEPPRSVVITWDTSGSVSHYIPRTLAAVRTWGRGLKPGRDALHLLPFGSEDFLLDDWAETPEALEPALADLPEMDSSDSETAMRIASVALAERRGARGIVVMTDAESSMNPDLWPAMLKAMPRVVSLSVDSNNRENAAVMMDWANVNGGRFQRVIGPLGLADGMEMANALFRAPKAYTMTATLEELVEPEGEASLTIRPAATGTPATGAVELVLDASGSMLQRMDGRRRIDIAHEALTSLVRDTLPEGTPFAFRAFGLEEDACRNELILPLAPLDREAAAKAIAGVPAINLAKTAIADSLRAAGQDLAEAAPPRVVVLVTDGEETCDGDPEAAIAELRESGFDARVNIVGFAIDDAALAETFAAWADQGGGTYFDAGSAEALQSAIGSALTPQFDIVRTWLDGRQEVVGRGALGETITVPAGRLTISPGSAATGEAVTVQVAPESEVSLDYTAGRGLSVLEQEAP